MGSEQSTPRRGNSNGGRRTTSTSPSGSSTPTHPKPPSSTASRSRSKFSSKRPTSKKPRRSASSSPTVASGSSEDTVTIYEPQRVVIIGAGPVGALAALYFAKGGWQVTVYELRGDLRNPENRSLNFTKSINLAISERGINGLRTVDPDLTDTILESAIPMHGRMIHDVSGKQSSQRYDVHGRFIRSIDRSHLNGALLDELDQMSNVELKFNHNLKRLALEKSEATFEKRSPGGGDPETIRVTADLFIGADGAHSQTRYHMMKYVRLNFSQEYIDSLWCEFHLPPHPETGDFQLDPNHLHIWPRHTFMFIALPNQDKSFTCTLFMPEELFKNIVGPEALLKFFLTEFPDVVPLIGEENLIADYLKNQKLPLISIKCNPYHYKNKCVILGDASHAMVPFYGQGMNCGFEDVRVLWSHIDSAETLSEALDGYTAERHGDLHVINDLAMNNYVEMRASVTSRTYLAKKHFQEFLYSWFPWMGVRTLYSMVSFSNIRYSEVVKRVKRQERVLGGVAEVVAMGVLMGLGWWVWRDGWWREAWKEGVLVWREWMEEAVRVLW